MTFYTIQSPGNRNEEVKKYLELKKYLRTRDSAEQMGELTRMDELSKFFKPISQPIGRLSEKIETFPTKISRALPSLPNIPSSSLPAIEESKKIEVPGDPELSEFMEQLTTNKLKPLINIHKGVLNIGGLPLTIKKDKIEYEGSTYKRTPELLDLIFSDEPSKESIENTKAKDDYGDILKKSGVLLSPRGKGANPKLTNSPKWKKLLGNIYKNIKGKGLLGGDWWSKWHGYNKDEEYKRILQRDGLGQKRGGNNKKTVFLSSDPEALVDRLTLLCGSAEAGNTGLRNEMVEICKELIRMKVMTQKEKQQILKNIKT